MENNQKDTLLKEELISLIQKGNAHASFEDAVEGVGLQLLTFIPDHFPYSIWQLIEHIRIAQWDIVEFCLSAAHQSPKWPDEYWPAAVETIDQQKLENALAQIKKDKKRFFELLKKPETDLYASFSYGNGQNLLREALLIADHTSYHVGEIIMIRRLLGNWKS